MACTAISHERDNKRSRTCNHTVAMWCTIERPHASFRVRGGSNYGAYPTTEGGGGGGGGGGLGCAVPRCRHIGCVVSHGAAAVCCKLHEFVLCFVEACLCFIVLVHLSCVTYVPCATMTWRGGGGGAMARYAMQWFV